jgi:hypothetical protein
LNGGGDDGFELIVEEGVVERVARGIDRLSCCSWGSGSEVDGSGGGCLCVLEMERERGGEKKRRRRERGGGSCWEKTKRTLEDNPAKLLLDD